MGNLEGATIPGIWNEAFAAELAIEGVDERVVGWFAWRGEVERDVTLVSSEVEIGRDELAALLDRIAFGKPIWRPTRSSTSTTSLPRKLKRISVAGVKREKVSTIVSTRNFRPVSA